MEQKYEVTYINKGTNKYTIIYTNKYNICTAFIKIIYILYFR